MMICLVCGDTASGFHKNEGPSCASCRVFFRRMAARATINPCLFNRNCYITVYNRRTSCMSCRYQKCRDIGMNPIKIAGHQKQIDNMSSMEPSIMEEKWIESISEMVYQSRNSQRDVDQVAEGAIQLFFGNSTNPKMVVFSMLRLTKMRFESLLKDLDETLIIDPIASANAMLWLGVKLQSSSVSNPADELKTAFNIAPSNPQCVKLPNIDYQVGFQRMEHKEAVEYKEISRDLAPFAEDKDIFALVSMVFLTGEDKMNSMLNKMLTKKLYQRFSRHDTINFIRSKMIKIIRLIPVAAATGISNTSDYRSRIMAEEEKCAFCREKKSKFRCSKCKTTKYCSKECQIQDWPMHRPICHMLK